LARHWRDPASLALPASLDWLKVVTLSEANRMHPLLYRALTTSNRLDALPEEARAKLSESVQKATENATKLAKPLSEYLQRAAAQGLETVVLKGLWLAVKLYGDPTLEDSLVILEGMGLGRWWPGLMHDHYYARHHLHQMRCSRDIEIWFEVHWTLDHPYTLLTTNMEELLDRTQPGELLGQPAREPTLPDLILSLAVHLVKHAVYLPSVLERPDLARIILADGMLIYYLDVAEVIKAHQADIDWPFTVELARQWGATTILGCVLRICREFLGAAVPDEVLAALPIKHPSRLTDWAMRRMADHEVSVYLGARANRIWGFLLLTSGTFILRPIRVLDSLPYFFPDGDFLQRRYGSATRATRLAHFWRATARYAELAADTVYYSAERYLHARSLKSSASRK
jgi:hypothetical protein